MSQNNQNEFPLVTGLESQTIRQTARHLPGFFRTDSNKKFLGGTLDPLTQPGKLTRINSYVGRRDIPNYSFDDNYEEEISNARQYYQLEPAFVYDDVVTGNVNWYADYNDYINSLKYFGAFTGNHSNLNKSEAYSWDPNIDWDKIVNFQEYYWLPNGPDPVTIYGNTESIISTFNLTSKKESDNIVYTFSSIVDKTVTDLLVANPILTLYRGQTYKFNVNARGAPFCITTRSELESIYFYSGFKHQMVETGTVEFTVPFDAPSVLYYMNKNDINTTGIIEIRDIKEATFLDVDLTITGKKTFISSEGIEFINGLKIRFSGEVFPEKYSNGNWYVEGVGDSIKLINSDDLNAPATYGNVLETPFDGQPFDSQPFEVAENYPITKDYVVINRSSKDRNVWSRNNRWFHINVITTSATVNKQDALLDQKQRAIRPIIEFSPNMKLFNYGWISKNDVDLVDTVTTDVFSTVEGATRFFIDEEQIYPGYRILFTADTDPLVSGRIFQVVNIFNANKNQTQISLQSVDDTDPVEGHVVYVTKGTDNKGSSFHYQNGKWSLAQKKIKVNQSPIFDLFDESYNSFSDTTVYPYNNFSGNTVFSYQIGSGNTDKELGFPLSYQSISNTGDIQFSFDLQKKSWTYQNNNILNTINSSTGFLRKLKDDGTFSYHNGWIRTYKKLEQPVVRILKVTKADTTLIPIDVYDESATVSGLSVRVYVNNNKINSSDISFENIQGYYYIKFKNKLAINDKVVYKVYSTMNKNARGYYEIPHNWQNNPLNETIDLFTYGEVVDHVRSMADNLLSFSGSFPGKSNLANIGSISHYGMRFLQHGGSMPLAAFVMTDKHANIIKSLRYTATKYSAFKKEFIRLATVTSIDGTPAEIVDSILLEYSNAKYYDLTPFYYSDMAASGAASIRNYVVEDPRYPIFVIDSIFKPMTSDKRQILVYVNNDQLLYGIDYTFETTDAFINITKRLNVGDEILIKDYINTDGRSYIPYTPTKLGLYPSYVPRIYIDDTYATPTKVIQGHDGSIVKCYGDYRDNLILELEKRIFNSFKIQYNPSIFDINEVMGGYYRKTDFSQAEIENLLLNDFLRWNTIADLDLSSNDYYIDENTFTYNYNNSLAPNNFETLYGYWRGVYKYFYDTDRPHTCPWEMQGFTIKPVWWDEVYGEAPYTSENKIMWDNIENGIIADPENSRINLKYVRTNLNKHIPVDSEGNLLSPLDSNLAQNFSLINALNEYSFGDQAPVETAWRRSSEFPYSIIAALCVLRGSEFIGKMWDRFTIKRNIAGQIYSTVNGLRIQPSNLTFPNRSRNNSITSPVTVTSGLVNFIEEYLFELKSTNVDSYKETLKKLNSKLSYRMSGYTSKDQINVLLDSRSPNATGTIFLPKENYKVFYNKSSPINSISYSGVIIEKMGSSYPQWIPGYRYHSDDRITFQGDVYHCITSHTSNSNPNLTSTNGTPLLVLQFNQDSSYWNKESISKTGYKVRGYDLEKNYFEVFGYRNSQTDPSINIGGISESYINWTGNTESTIKNDLSSSVQSSILQGNASDSASKQIYYTKGQIVRVNNNQYYRSIIGHTASSTFEKDIDKWAPLSKLPITGGVSAIRRTRFGENVIKVNYGTIFSSIQSVVDFLLGYQKRLEILGFIFDDYSKDLDVPLTWLTSAKEFMFWTLQNWLPGAVITLSPAANKIKFVPTMNASVDNTDTDFYDYSIFKADGSPLKADLTNVYRENSGFIIKPGVETNDGIFHIKANLVYKEHVLLFDNVSIFNDILYDKIAGYRQGRLKLVGYKTMYWDGGYTSPGFMYDEAIINEWVPNTDYMIGDIIKYKNYYFSAPTKILSKPTFEYNDWKQLTSAPVAGLIPNFDYRAEQFRDFYSLEASNFNSIQETLARHLIGYQPRQYIANIINDEVAQFKFYQGFIKEKGTRNSVDKLFDVLRSSGFGNINIKEEWAFKIGEYGATDAYTEIEFPLDEQRYLHNPQNINLTANSNGFVDLATYNISFNEISIKPSSYNNNPFKTKKIDTTQYNYDIFKYQVAGYVRDEDVDHIIINESALLNYDTTLFKDKDKIWVGYTSNTDWNVYEYLNTNIIIVNWSVSENIVSLQCNVIPDVNVDDIIVISNLDELDGSYKVQNVYNNIIEIYTFNSTLFTIQDNVTSGGIHILKSSRFDSLSSVSANRYNTKDIRSETIWIDSDKSGKWLVLKNQDVFTESEKQPPFLLNSDQKYGYDVKISANGKWMFVSSVNLLSGSVHVYNRSSDSGTWVLTQTLTLPVTYLNTVSYTEKFGKSIDVTDDGSTLFISSPDANDLRTTPVNGINIGLEGADSSELTKQGIVVVYVYNKDHSRYELDIIISSYDAVSNEGFGSKIKIANDATNLWLFVSSEAYNSSRGRVQIFRKTNDVWVSNTQKYLDTSINFNSGDKYGYDIDCTSGANLVAISAPYRNSGAVYIFVRSALHTFSIIETINSDTMSSGLIPSTVQGNTYLHDEDGFGYSIAINDDLLFVSCPNDDTKGYNVGSVYIFNKSAPKIWQGTATASSGDTKIIGKNTKWKTQANPGDFIVIAGQHRTISSNTITDNVMYVTEPFDIDINEPSVISIITGYGLSQYILPPIINLRERFGNKISINPSNNILAVSAQGGDSIIPMTFDNYSDRVASDPITIGLISGNIAGGNNETKITGIAKTSNLFIGMTLVKTSGIGSFGGTASIKSIDSPTEITVTTETTNLVGSITFTANGYYYSYELDPNSGKLNNDGTTFDNDSLKLYDTIPYTGAVYIYNKFDDHFIYADRLRPVNDLITDDNFGSSISVSDSAIAVGTPSRIISGGKYGTVFTFDYSTTSWKIDQSQDSLIDISKFKKAFIYNTKKNTLIEPLDFYDPAKGRIPAIADQEIKFQTYYDPAIYQYGVPSEVSVDESIPWTDEHIGELWWDLTNVKFTWYEQGDSTYRANNWGRIFPGCTIDIYEWVETTYLPSKWAELADTEAGLTLGISGIPKDIDNFTWSSKFKYDPISGTNTTLYYYWVKNKRTVPTIPTRNLSCADVANLILDPKSQGYQFVSITSPNSLSISNIKNKLIDTDVSLNLQFYEVENTELLTHREYVLIANDDVDAVVPKIIENKWFDSLVGTNSKGQIVPDFKLNTKQRYGNLNSPRQSWFINRFEALKQLVEYTNSILSTNLIVDSADLSNLRKNDPAPTLNSSEIDQIIDVLYELKFVGTTRLRTAIISIQQIIDGKLTKIAIQDSGYGYGRNKTYSYDTEGNALSWYGPTVNINGVGTGAFIQTEIDIVGRVINAYITKSGEEYDDNTSLTVRDYKVLVRQDEEANNSWSIQTWNPTNQEWLRTNTQAYDVTRYWNYIDWYKAGFGLSSDISYQVERTVDLNGLPAVKGDIVKINNVGYGNWILLHRLDETNSLDFTDDYEVVGRQNGTIQFSEKLYNLDQSTGFDTNYSFDLNFYDQSSITELRIILETLRDDILVGDLRIEYIRLFFNSIYYVLSEQLYTDWCFKTSFLKINHSVGTLKERITFKSDEIQSYESFLEEAKPYKTKIREWISSYQLTENSNTLVTDFDLPSFYNTKTNSIERTTKLTANVNTYPWKNWLDNNAYQVSEIIIKDGGSNYTTTPIVIISGTGTGAKATAYVANGSVYRIVVTEHGYGYTEIPTITISGGNGTSISSNGIVRNDNAGRQAIAYATIGNGLVRTNLIGMKFDRLTHSYTEDNFRHSDYFIGNGSRTTFKLTFAPEIEKSKFIVLVDNIEYYGLQYNIMLGKSTHDTYTALDGYIEFAQAPGSKSNIEVTYYKNIELYSAADRINYSYNPTAGQYGKDLGQLMTGIDYSGVTVTSIDFDVGGGWDVLPWDVTAWDNVLSSNDEFVVLSDGITRTFTLPYIPVVDEVINIYVERTVTFSTTIYGTEELVNPVMMDVYDIVLVRQGDDVKVKITDNVFRFAKVVAINHDTIILDREILGIVSIGTTIEFSRTVTIRADDNDIQNSFYGDSIHNEITISDLVALKSGDLIIFRKSTSDGSVLPLDKSILDSMISGGNFTTALGINAADIVIDGDKFVTTDTSHGPEELVQGNVFDTLDMKIYHTPSAGGPNVYINNYTGNGIKNTFNLSHIPGTLNGIIALIKNTPVKYSVDFAKKTITLNTVPPIGSKVSIMTFDTAGYDILDKLTIVGDGKTKSYLTAADYSKDNVTVFITVDGIEAGASISSSKAKNGKVIVELTDIIPSIDSVIQIMVFSGTIKKYSKVTTTPINIDISKTEYDLSNYINYLEFYPGVNQPLSANVFVEVDGNYLAPPDYQNFVYIGEGLPIVDPRYLPNSLLESDLHVYLNGNILEPNLQFNFDSASNTVIIGSDIAVYGDEIIIEIVQRNDFFISDNKLIFTGRFDLFKYNTINLTTFTNHNILKNKRTNKGFTFTIGYDIQGYGIYSYDLSSKNINSDGIFDLPRPVSNTTGVFVVLSRKLLSPNVDYILLDNMRQIKVSLPNDLIGSDYIEIITTNEQTTHPSFGFKIFKDMMNRTSYKVLDNKKTTELSKDLKITDTTITVKDGTVLTDVENKQKKGNKKFGTIEINGEIIEYFVKNGNILSQLRRGMFGTSISQNIPAGTKVFDSGLKTTIPYDDLEIKTTAYGNGIEQDGMIVGKQIFDFDFVPSARYVKTDDNKTKVPFTYKKTIPNGYYPCDQLEVYVAGRRLFKDPRVIHDQNTGQDSYKSSGNITLEAEFSVDGISKSVRLTQAPKAGELVVIIAKRGNTWQSPTEKLPFVYSSSNVAVFVNSKHVDLPK